jgi:DNA-binding MarR family transcriptional regulator
MEPTAPDALRLIRRVFQLDLVLHQAIDRPLRASTGLSTTELFVLRAAALGFDRPRQIARRLALAPPNVSRALATLERADLIVRHEASDDRRQTVVRVTGAARSVLALAQTVAVTELSRSFPGLTPDTLAKAVPMLDALWHELGVDAVYGEAPSAAHEPHPS